MKPSSSIASRSPSPGLGLSRLCGVRDASERRDPLARIVLIHSGAARILHDGNEAAVTSGSVLFIPPAVPHRLDGGSDLNWSLIRFAPHNTGLLKWAITRTPEFGAFFKALLAEKPTAPLVRILHLIPRHADQAAALVGEIDREWIERRPGWEDLVTGHFQHLVILLSRCAGKQLRICSDAMDRVTPAIRHIDANFATTMDPMDLAKSCGMSERTFYRVFSQATGQSPRSYLKRVRIEKAADRLRKTDTTVTEIAFAVGFEDSNFFAREFRKAQGFAPTEYRRRWQA